MKKIAAWVVPLLVLGGVLTGGYVARDKPPPLAATLYWASGKAVRMGDTESALAMLKELAEFNEGNPLPLAVLGDIQHLRMLGMPPGPEREALARDAETNLRRALELQPRFLRAKIRLASLLAKLKRYDEARGLLDQALDKNPYSKEAHEVYARLLWDLGETKEARPHFLASFGDDLDPSLAGQERAFSFPNPRGYATTSGHRLNAPVEFRFVINDPVLYQGVLIALEWEKDYMQATLYAAVAIALKDFPDRPGPEQIKQAELTALDYLRTRNNLARVGLEPVSLEILSVEPVEQ